MREMTFLNKIWVMFIMALVFSTYAFSASWVLAASKFSFSQGVSYSGRVRESSEDKVASLMPELILEHIVAPSSRLPSEREVLDRYLERLLLERQSLFLQLSKEIKVRDSLFLSEEKPSKLKKAIAEQEKKIKEIQDKIDANLANADKAVAQVEERIAGVKKEKEGFSFVSIKKLFFAEDSEEELVSRPEYETIELYKGSASTLYEPPQKALLSGTDSRLFAKAAMDEKINGLILGSITRYGDYISVTAEFKIFPGGYEKPNAFKNGTSVGVVTEVGNIDNCMQIARNIARYIIPKIVNSMSVQLYIDISPAEAASKYKLMVDGVVTRPEADGKSVYVPAGVHTVEVESDSFNTSAVTYDFKGSPTFLVHIPMQKQASGSFSVNLKKPEEGKLYAGGNYIGDVKKGVPGASARVNSSNLLGSFVSSTKTTEASGDGEEATPLGFYYYVPQSEQVDGSSLMVNAESMDTESLIDKRRRWTYASYSAFIMSLPFTFATTGSYVNSLNAYYKGYGTRDEAVRKNNIRLGCSAVSVVTGVVWVANLVWYLHTASKVLPVKAKPASEKDIQKAREKSMLLDSGAQKKAEKKDKAPAKDKGTEKAGADGKGNAGNGASENPLKEGERGASSGGAQNGGN